MSGQGLIGGIRSTFWRRVALVLVGTPMLVGALVPVYLKALPNTLKDAILAAGDAFTMVFAYVYERPNSLLSLSFKAAWSRDWNSAE